YAPESGFERTLEDRIPGKQFITREIARPGQREKSTQGRRHNHLQVQSVHVVLAGVQGPAGGDPVDRDRRSVEDDVLLVGKRCSARQIGRVAARARLDGPQPDPPSSLLYLILVQAVNAAHLSYCCARTG